MMDSIILIDGEPCFIYLIVAEGDNRRVFCEALNPEAFGGYIFVNFVTDFYNKLD